MRLLDGATFALDAPAEVDSAWGGGSRVLWATGEPLMIVKPDGVGGTTLAQQASRSIGPASGTGSSSGCR